MEAAHLFRSTLQPTELAHFYRFVRETSKDLADSLSDADATNGSTRNAATVRKARRYFFIDALLRIMSSQLKSAEQRTDEFRRFITA